MKKIILLLSVLMFAIMFWGCPIPEKICETTFITRDSNMLKVRTLGEEPIIKSVIVDQVDFRSSHIEFWSINTIEDVNKLTSAYYEGTNSTYVDLKDIEKTFIFKPNELAQFTKKNNVVFENKKYNIIRLDIGGGDIVFTIDEKIIENLSLNCNSIVFVDREFLPEGFKLYFVSRNDADDNISSEIPIIDAIIKRGNIPNAAMDINGALFIPFEATDFSKEEIISSVIVDVSWNLENLVKLEGEDYIMIGRDGKPGLCFDLEVILLVE